MQQRRAGLPAKSDVSDSLADFAIDRNDRR
jgi:hypothetical protein